MSEADRLGVPAGQPSLAPSGIGEGQPLLAQTGSEEGQPLLALSGIEVEFPGVKALRGVDLARPGADRCTG